MPEFEFSARDSSGQTQTGAMDAVSAGAVAAQLREQGWRVVRIRPSTTQQDSDPGGWFAALLAPRSVHIELSLRQLAVMLRGGISLLAAMQTIAEESDRRAVCRVYERMIGYVQQGHPLSHAMEQEPGFPEFIVRLVRVGERTGIQETVLVQGADMMRTRRETVREVLSALTYPMIVLVAASGATWYMVSSLIPKLTTLLQSLGKPLPPITQSLVVVTDFVQQWGTIVTVGGFSSVALFIVIYLTESGRLLIDRWALRIPVVGKILRISGTLTFSQTLSTLINSGVTVLDALVTIQQMHANRYLAQLVQRSRDAIIRGNNLADTLRVKHAYMPLLATMTAVGEQSGNLDEVLDQVTEFHTAQLKAMIRTLSAWLTPAIIVVVGSVVGYVYIAFFAGMFSIAR